MTTASEKAKIADLVRSELRSRSGPGEIRFDPAAIHREDGLWVIPVWPEGKIGEQYRYCQILTEVGMAIEDKHHIDVFLRPSASPAWEQGQDSADA